MEGKKFRALGKNCHAVSEVYGQLLMISIVVIAFSTIAVTVFSDGGAVKPEHIPNTDLRENVDMKNSSISITHGGGEAIDMSAIKIILSVKKAGDPDLKHLEFSGSNLDIRNPNGNNYAPSNNAVFMLGDFIIIDTTKPDGSNGLTLESNDDIDMFFVDMPSQQVIQKAVLQKGSREREFPYWITPHPYGSVYDNSTNEWLPTEMVDGIGDGLTTDCQMYQNQWSSENFTFGIDEYGLDLKNPLTLVLLKIVYTAHDASQKELTLEINDKNPNQWVIVAGPGMIAYNNIATCDKELKPIDITDNVSTVEELRNLTVRFSAYGHANSDNKFGWVDFIGIHVEC